MKKSFVFLCVFLVILSPVFSKDRLDSDDCDMEIVYEKNREELFNLIESYMDETEDRLMDLFLIRTNKNPYDIWDDCPVEYGNYWFGEDVYLGFSPTSHGPFLRSVRFYGDDFLPIHIGDSYRDIEKVYGKMNDNPFDFAYTNDPYDRYIIFYDEDFENHVSCIEIGKTGW